MTSRTNHSEVIREFLKSDEFGEIVSNLFKKHTDNVQEKIAELKNEVLILRESNIQLLHLLMNEVQTTTEVKSLEKSSNLHINFSKVNNNMQSVNSKVSQTKNGVNKTRSRSVSTSSGTKNKKTQQASDHNIIHNNNFRHVSIEANKNKDHKPEYENVQNNDDEKWQQQRRKQRRRNIIYGKSNNNETFKGVTRLVDFHVFRCPLNLTCEELMSYLRTKKITDVKCEKMISKYPDTYTSFKVSIPSNSVKQIMDPEIWPQHVCVDRFNSRFLRPHPSNSEVVK